MKLEFIHFKRNPISAIFFFSIPIILIIIFYIIGNSKVSGTLSFYDLQAPGIFAFIILFITIQLTTLRIIGERAPYGTLDRELLAISKEAVFFGKLIANFIISLIVCVLIFTMGVLIFNAKNQGSILTVFIIFILIALIGLLIGLNISVFSKSKEQAIQIVPFFVLGLLIISGIFISTPDMAQGMRGIADNSPFTLTYHSLKQTMLEGKGSGTISTDIFKSVAWIIGLIFLGLIGFKYERK